jgi:hypothetical protein
MNDKDDQQWLDALAGKPDTSAATETNAQATALRAAMLARRAALEHETANADPAEFARLQARLRRESLLTTTSTSTKQVNTTWLSALLGKWLPDGGSASTLPIWSLAANVVLAVAVLVQLGLPSTSPDDATDVLRSGTATVLLVGNPDARLAELTAGLDLAKAHYVVLRKATGELQLIVQANDATVEYLQTQRVEPRVIEGLVVIGLRSAK